MGLIDVGEQDFYVLDIHRARGGNEHWWSFHGPCGEAIAAAGCQEAERERA